jgi:hypothetical protein
MPCANRWQAWTERFCQTPGVVLEDSGQFERLDADRDGLIDSIETAIGK